MIKRLLLFSLLLALFLPVQAQQYVMIQGSVKNIASEPLQGAHATNITRRFTMYTDINGQFQMAMAIGDTLQVSMMGYKPFSMAIPRNLSSYSYRVEIVLRTDTISLPVATIRAYPETYEEFRKAVIEHRAVEEVMAERLDLPENYGHKNTLPTGGVAMKGPFSIAYDLFSKDAKERRKMNAIITKIALRQRVYTVVREETLKELIGMKQDEEVDEFLAWCGISGAYLDLTRDYDVARRLRECARGWKMINPN